MSLVKVKTKGQVTLPSILREQAGLRVGDLLDAKVVASKITLVFPSQSSTVISQKVWKISRRVATLAFLPLPKT